MDPSRLTERVVDFYQNRTTESPKLRIMRWISVIKEDLDDASIGQHEKTLNIGKPLAITFSLFEI